MDICEQIDLLVGYASWCFIFPCQAECKPKWHKSFVLGTCVHFFGFLVFSLWAMVFGPQCYCIYRGKKKERKSKKEFINMENYLIQACCKDIDLSIRFLMNQWARISHYDQDFQTPLQTETIFTLYPSVELNENFNQMWPSGHQLLQVL